MQEDTWRLVHTFEPPIRLNAGSLTHLPGLDLTLDADGKLTDVRHTLTAERAATQMEMEKRGRALIQGAILAIRYLQVAPVNWWSTATNLNSSAGGIGFTVHATATLGSRAIDLPNAGWLGEMTTEILAWTVLAAQARESPVPSIRLRIYFLVLEDFDNRAKFITVGERDTFADIKAVRDFVSHPKIESKKTRERLTRIAPKLLGANGELEYNPLNFMHESTVLQFSDRAGRIVDSALLVALGVRANYWS